ncbi:cysteine desulfurase family protein [Parashewanella tropica]|uniref:cysteine desulfurase family protein n=1 Tax=Parashewanella tropica TaxID=2547970 RepID=UPI00105A5D5B|nr:cysteine desulfurase family protein [Parashewanella tropica]
MNSQDLSGYFDYNATTPVSNEVANSMIAAITQFANPSSNNRHSIKSKEAISESRKNVASLLSTVANKIFFTSGGSEANNWAIKGVLFKHISKPGHILTTAIEHASVLETIKYFAEHFGFEVTYLKPNKDGSVTTEDFRNALRKDTQLVSVMYANNETGVLQPIPEIAQLAKERGIPIHVDAVQLVGKRKINVENLEIDYLSLSAHKFYGPKGIGCLWIRDVNSIPPLIHGGGQELSMRSGTENFVSIMGASKAAQEALLNIEQWEQNNWSCKQYMVELLRAAPIEVKFNGKLAQDAALSNTLSITIKGVRGEALGARMELLNSYVISVGSACSNNSKKNISHVLKAMNIKEHDIQSTIRVSFGRFTSLQDIEKFVTVLVAETQNLLAIGEG